jgi:hypothetical protein
MFTSKEPKPYHVSVETRQWASDQDLEKWSKDTLCLEMTQCAELLVKRAAKREAARLAKIEQLAERKKALDEKPFDARTEISADARHIASRIVTQLWVIFVLLPIVLVLLYELLK